MTTLNDQGRSELLRIARSTLESALSTGKIPEITITEPALLEYAGAFVSLHEQEDLRGCIGQIVPDRELYRIVQSCAINAALDDPRFPSVAAAELPRITIEISVLTSMERVTDSRTIEVGRHGLYIVQGSRRGLLLPQVATRYDWDRETFLAQTCRKAGLREDAWRDRSTAICRFEAQVFSDGWGDT
jgi:AmmeMemoRadiSam system protein A